MVRFSIASPTEIVRRIVPTNAIEVRDVDDEENPFVYSSGNRGPGYVMIKGLTGQPEVLKFLTRQLAYKLLGGEAQFDFIEGNATGGMVPGWQLRNDISEILRREVPYCYLRGSRKEGGHGELITGDANNPLIQKGMKALVVEELVNYAETTCNAAETFRREGYAVSHAACILSYDHAESNERLKRSAITLIPLITLPELLDIAGTEKILPETSVRSYKEFLRDPINWQLQRGLVIPEDSAKKAIGRGYKMVKLSLEEAIKEGAPEDKAKSGFVYWKKVG